MTYHCEIYPTHEKLDLISSLIPEHFSEAQKRGEYEGVKIDYDYFYALSTNGMAFIVTLNKRDSVIGYAIFTVAQDPIRQGTVEATNVCFYVKEAFRGIGTKKLVEKSNEFMKKLGAVRINYLIKDSGFSCLLRSVGYEKDSELWSIKV